MSSYLDNSGLEHLWERIKGLIPTKTSQLNNDSNYITAGNIPKELPSVGTADNGKVLMVVNGAWSTNSVQVYYTGTSTPSNTQGNNGDIYLQT